MVSYIGLLSLCYFSCEAAPLRQGDRAWGGWAPRPSHSQQRKAVIPLLQEPVSAASVRILEVLTGTRCEDCHYFCTLPLGLVVAPSCMLNAELVSGHNQQEHETRHGPTSRIKWAIETGDGTDETVVKLEGRKFWSKNDGNPLLCNFVCTSMGRHVHIDYCRGDPCDNPGTQHINQRMAPDPDHAKDWITHDLHWRRMGKRIL